MRIIDLQRRLREVGRIRIGEQVPSSNGRTRPKKLHNFRLTSRDQLVIDAAAERWGGEARPWDGAPDGAQWEVFTETSSLPVVVPPGDMSFSQAYEQWTAGGCKVRCDGRWDHIADKACHCNPEARACDIHTRLSVMLPDLPGVGVWRLDTQGYYAAVELGGIVDLVAAHSERGVMLPARLRLEQRSVKRIDNGKVVTRNFAVPVLDVDVHPLQLANGPGTPVEIGASAPALPVGNLTPVPEPDGQGIPSLEEQMRQVDEPTRRPARANAAAPLPSTGLRPRTAAEVAADAPADSAPSDAVQLQATLNSLGTAAVRAFLSEFGCAPSALPSSRLAEAALFVSTLAPFDGPDGGGGSPVPAHGAEADEEVGDTGADPAPPASDSDRAREPVGATFGVRDVARYAGEVFKADYDAAPRGTKTKVLERLRHALVYAQTSGTATSLNELDVKQLIGVHGRLRDIAEGRMTYAPDDQGVIFQIVGSDHDPVRITWAQLEETAAA